MSDQAKVPQATDEEVAEMKQRHQKTALYERCNDCWYGKWPCPTAKLLARLEAVEAQLRPKGPDCSHEWECETGISHNDPVTVYRCKKCNHSYWI